LDFSTIDTQEKAYILGFWAADGWAIHREINGYEIGLELSNRDEKHLILLRDLICPLAKIHSRIRNGNRMVSFRFSDKKVFFEFAKHGIVQNKTKYAEIPSLEVPFIRHYIRGVLDGDGCISLHKDNKNSTNKKWLRTTFVGHKNVLNFIKNEAEIYNPSVLGNLKETKGNYCILDFYHKASLVFLHWLYWDATIYLARKYSIAASFLEEE
jgi:hypothetical protein